MLPGQENREVRSHLHVHQHARYLQLESRTTTLWPNTITAGTLRLVQPAPPPPPLLHKDV